MSENVVVEPHVVVASTAPTGAEVKAIIAMTATPIRARATQTPAPRNRKSKNVRMREIDKISNSVPLQVLEGSICARFFLCFHF